MSNAEHGTARAPTVERRCRDEWPIVKAAVPPAAEVAVGPLLGLDVRGGLLAGAHGWRGRPGGLVGGRGARRASASWRLVAATASVNLLLGLLIIAFKVILKH